ncbi:stealth conserved region 3 domain-containing protein [soil metagenome]
MGNLEATHGAGALRRRARLESEQTTAWRRSIARGDVIRHKGRLALLNSTLTPHQAMTADLLFVRAALDDAGVPFRLIAGADDRPVIAVDRADRKAVRAALVEACATEPFYAKAPGKRAVLVADGRLSERGKPRVIRLFRPRVEPSGLLAYGTSTAVQLEFWSFGETEVDAPTENMLMRRTIPTEELVESTVERYGESWRTFEPMFTPVVSDISFDIDMVFSWVDGTDLEFQRARARRMQSYVVGEGDDHAARFRQIDELRYALRSVHLFAPWVRRIFIATDSPAPYWLADHPKVTIMRSEQFFADTSVLPTHNSQGVESQLHNIPGLAEHFLYSNDDMFFGRPLSPHTFFSPGGITKFIEADTRIGLGGANRYRSGFENSARVNRELLRDRFGVTITRHLEHSAAPLRKSVIRELEAAFPEDFARTAASPFRSSTDISVTNSLYHYYALASGKAERQTNATVKYVDTTLRTGIADMEELLAKRSYDMFCLNDGSFPELSAEDRAFAVRSFLDRYYAIPAPWEKSDVLDAEISAAR